MASSLPASTVSPEASAPKLITAMITIGAMKPKNSIAGTSTALIFTIPSTRR